MEYQYDTLAVCNALMDVEIKLSEEELKQLKFPKSSMTLVEVEESNDLLKRFQNKPKQYCSGGSVGNTLYAMAKLGRKVGVIVNIGKDEFGKKYRQSYKRVGVDFFGREWDKRTGVCLVFITPDTARTMVTTLGCSSDFTEELLQQVYSLSTKSIYLESYLLVGDKNIKLFTRMVDQLKKTDKKVILSDSDWFGYHRCPSAYKKLFKQVDVYFSNADQLRAMSGYDHEDTMDVEKQFYKFSQKKQRPDLWVVTNSEHGAYLTRVEENNIRSIHVPAHKVKVVDSNGAGDGFAAGVMTEYFKGSGITQMGNRGTEIASQIITRFGARYR